MNLLVAIPALNEESSIAKVIKDVKEHIPSATILVIDDGSTDSTAAIARNSGANVISLPFNVGVGGAIRVAFKFASENSFTHLMQIDADGQHLPSEASELIAASQGNCIVVGSRFLDSKNSYKVGIARKLAMKTLAAVTGRICNTKLSDVTSGFRIASGTAIPIFANAYPREYLGDTVESLIIAHKAGVEIKEIPVTMNQREFGNASQNLLKSSWYLFRVLLMIGLASLKKSGN